MTSVWNVLNVPSRSWYDAKSEREVVIFTRNLAETNLLAIYNPLARTIVPRTTRSRRVLVDNDGTSHFVNRNGPRWNSCARLDHIGSANAMHHTSSVRKPRCVLNEHDCAWTIGEHAFLQYRDPTGALSLHAKEPKVLPSHSKELSLLAFLNEPCSPVIVSGSVDH